MNVVEDLVRQYHQALEALPLQILRGNPTLPLADAAEFLNQLGQGHRTGLDIYGDAASPTGPCPEVKRGKKKPEPKGKGKKAGPRPLEAMSLLKRVNRDKADRMVLEFLRTRGVVKWVTATEIRNELGGNADKMRGILNRLIANGAVAYDGYGNATRYKKVGQ